MSVALRLLSFLYSPFNIYIKKKTARMSGRVNRLSL
jgi:hypothetical protein